MLNSVILLFLQIGIATAAFIPSTAFQKRLSSSFISKIIYDQNIFWLTELEVGSTGQKVYVHFDTGSADLVIPLINSTGAANCSGTNFCFDASQSDTLKVINHDFSTQYVGGQDYSGSWVTDTLKIGDITVKDFRFAVADNISISSYGVFGVGPKEGESIVQNIFDVFKTYENFPFKLKSDKTIAKVLFGVYIVDDSTAEVQFGTIDPSKYTGELKAYDIQMIPLYEKVLKYFPFLKYFTSLKQYYLGSNILKLKCLSIDSEEVYQSDGSGTGGLPTVIDTGGTLEFIPQLALEKIVNKTGAIYKENDNMLYYVPCNSNFSVNFSFDGSTTYNFTSSEFLLDSTYFQEDALNINGTDMCFLPFRGYDDSDELAVGAFGTTFLKHFYSVYDYENYQIHLGLRK